MVRPGVGVIRSSSDSNRGANPGGMGCRRIGLSWGNSLWRHDCQARRAETGKNGMSDLEKNHADQPVQQRNCKHASPDIQKTARKRSPDEPMLNSRVRLGKKVF